MTLWIRSRNNLDVLIDCTGKAFYHASTTQIKEATTKLILGNYSSPDRVKQILNEIQEQILKNQESKLIKIYELPED